MQGLEDGVNIAAEELSRLESGRESVISCSRRIIRLTKTVIHAIHTGGPYSEQKEELESEVMDLNDLCGVPMLMASGPAQDAMSEYAEAMIFEAAVTCRPIPSCNDLGIPAGAWVLGLADSIGELRRMVMTMLVDEDLEGAKTVFGMMEEIHSKLVMLDVPDAVVPLRRKQDIARGVMDRTRSDITLASIMNRKM